MPKFTLRALSLLSLLVACSRAEAPAPKPLAASPAAPPALNMPEERDPLPLAERLRREASDHPEARARVEASLSALRNAGVTLTRTRQALARPLRAQYCVSALTAAGLGVALCAFPNHEAAQAGRALSQHSFDRLIPGRTLLVGGATLLTFTAPASSEAHNEAERMRAGFLAEPSEERAAL